ALAHLLHEAVAHAVEREAAGILDVLQRVLLAAIGARHYREADDRRIRTETVVERERREVVHAIDAARTGPRNRPRNYRGDKNLVHVLLRELRGVEKHGITLIDSRRILASLSVIPCLRCSFSRG